MRYNESTLQKPAECPCYTVTSHAVAYRAVRKNQHLRGPVGASSKPDPCRPPWTAPFLFFSTRHEAPQAKIRLFCSGTRGAGRAPAGLRGFFCPRGGAGTNSQLWQCIHIWLNRAENVTTPFVKKQIQSSLIKVVWLGAWSSEWVVALTKLKCALVPTRSGTETVPTQCNTKLKIPKYLS